MSKQLFVKVGRRYVLWGNATSWHDADVMRAGQIDGRLDAWLDGLIERARK